MGAQQTTFSARKFLDLLCSPPRLPVAFCLSLCMSAAAFLYYQRSLSVHATCAGLCPDIAANTGHVLRRDKAINGIGDCR